MCLLSVHTNREMQAWADKVAVAVVAFLYVLGPRKQCSCIFFLLLAINKKIYGKNEKSIIFTIYHKFR